MASSAKPEVDSDMSLATGSRIENAELSSPLSRYGSPPGTASSYLSKRVPIQKPQSVYLSYDDTNPTTVAKVNLLKTRLESSGKTVTVNTVRLSLYFYSHSHPHSHPYFPPVFRISPSNRAISMKLANLSQRKLRWRSRAPFLL